MSAPQSYSVFSVPRLDKAGTLFIAPFTHSAACPLSDAVEPGLANFMAGATPTDEQPCVRNNAAVELVTATTVEAFPLEASQRIWVKSWARDRDEAIQEARRSIRLVTEMLARHPVRRRQEVSAP